MIPSFTDFMLLTGNSNPNFAEKAPSNVVSECRANLSTAESQVRLVKSRLLGLE